MKLVVVESPTKAKTLSRFLGTGYQIEATMGHIRDLPETKLGIKIVKKEGGLAVTNFSAPPGIFPQSLGQSTQSDENKEISIKRGSKIVTRHSSETYNFIPEYVLVAKKKEAIERLKQEAKKADGIILATDPDREGEAIAWHTAAILGELRGLRGRGGQGGKNQKKLPPSNSPNTPHPPSSPIRIVFHEITEQAIKGALASPREIDMNLVDAQQARRVLDRLVGYKLSPLLWIKIRRNLSAGRVQSVTVRLIVEREREIKAFKPEEYWQIQAEFGKLAPEANQTTFLASLVSKDAQKIEIKNKDEADKIVSELKTLSYQVKDIKISDIFKYPFPPFTTSTMQQAASTLFGWSSKRTMQVSQGLYEKGLITYHRTDSVNLASQAIVMARQFIEKEYGKEYLPDSPRIYKTKSKVAQEAHEAIRPTKLIGVQLTAMQRDEERLYFLIWKRFVACQMREAIFTETKVDVEGGAIYLFRAVGSKLKFVGWKKVFQNNNDLTKEAEEEEAEKELPSLAIGETLKLVNILPTQKFTEPPARYTEATLIKTLEEKGIGRPSTYAPIISTIQERQYVEKIERKFFSTVLGEVVNDFLVKNFPKIVDISFTAKMEDDLDEIANGKLAWGPVLSEFYSPFLEKLNQVKEKAKRVKVPTQETSEKCPKCNSPLVIRIGRFGKFLACSRFPDCDFTKSYSPKTGLNCPNCGAEIIVRRTKKGKQFYGCSSYPKCTFAAWRKDQILSKANL
jgi:DNA topoisomerase-1